MIKLLEKRELCDEFLLPLTGLKRDDKYNLKSYLYWGSNTIDDYKLILTLSCDDGMLEYCNSYLFPILDQGGYLLESYDVGDKSIFILDMSEWAMDIQMFLAGRYSKFSKDAKKLIERYHTFNKNEISVRIMSVLYPSTKSSLLDDMTPMEYIAVNYGLCLEDIQRIGEIGSLYDVLKTTLPELSLKEEYGST